MADIIFLVTSFIIGMAVGYAYKSNTCDHYWKKVAIVKIVDEFDNPIGHKIVYICKKCGKKKILKV